MIHGIHSRPATQAPADFERLADFSLPKIGFWVVVSAIFAVAFATSPHWPGSNEPTLLHANPALGAAFFGIASVLFVALLLRTLISGRVAVYLSNGCLCWVRVFSLEKLPLQEIRTVSKYVTPGMIVLVTSKGRRRFLASGVTNMSTDGLIEAIRRATRAA